MIKQKIRWGILGTARINRRIIPAIRASHQGELLAVASRSPEKAFSYAQEWKIAKSYDSYDALLEDPEIDCVYIPLPNDLHLEWTRKALEAGKHVLCEKPLALTPNQVEQIIEASRKTGYWVAEAFMYRHHSQTLQVVQMVRDGALGLVPSMRGAFTFFLDRPDDIRWKPEHGGGALLDVGCYPISYALLLAGCAPTSVFGWRKLAKSGVDIHFAGHLLFPTGTIFQFDCSFAAFPQAYFEVVGTIGKLSIPSPFRISQDQPILFWRGKTEQKIKYLHQDPYVAEIEDMNQAILKKRRPLIGLEESLLLSQVLAALQYSAEMNEPVSL